MIPARHVRLSGKTIFGIAAFVLFLVICSSSVCETSGTDADGISDSEDQCNFSIPGVSKPDAYGCPTVIDPFAELDFDHSQHRLWYRRFWTGNCDGVKGFCFPGKKGASSPTNGYWHDLVERLQSRVQPEEAGMIRLGLWMLGREIGWEWARDNDVRRIDTGDLRMWYSQLDTCTAPFLFPAIIMIEMEASEKLGE